MAILSQFRKPRSHAVNGSPDSSTISEQTTPQSQRPPVLRNFSYPTHVGSSGPVPSSSHRRGQTTWDQWGEICNFSPDTVGKAQCTGCEEPFFYKRDPVPYMPLSGEESEFTTSTRHNRVASHKSLTKDEAQARKRQRRTAMLSLPLLLFQGKQAGTPDSDPHKQEGKRGRASKVLSIGGHIFPRRYSAITGLKHTSWGHRGVSTSRGSQTRSLPRESPGHSIAGPGSLIFEPMNEHAGTDFDAESCTTIPHRTDIQNSFQHDVEQSVFTGSRSSYQSLRLNDSHRRTGPQGAIAPKTTLFSGLGEANRTLQPVNDSGREGKGTWLSHLRNWVSTAGPSTQASKQHRVGAFEKKGVAIHSPRANAKLHLPIGMLSPEPVKSKRPDSERVRHSEEERKKGRRSYNGSIQMSQGSLSSTSRHTSFSSASASSTTYDTRYWA